MAKVRTQYDSISPCALFQGNYSTTIDDGRGNRVEARGFTREESREKAEDKYDAKVNNR